MIPVDGYSNGKARATSRVNIATLIHVVIFILVNVDQN